MNKFFTNLFPSPALYPVCTTMSFDQDTTATLALSAMTLTDCLANIHGFQGPHDSGVSQHVSIEYTVILGIDYNIIYIVI